MICRHCHKDLPWNFTAKSCPECGAEVFPESPQPAVKSYSSWLVFFIVLCAPAAVTFVGGMINSGGVIFSATFPGSLIAGLICGWILAEKRPGPEGASAEVMVVFSLAIPMILVSFVLCFAGCMVPLYLKNVPLSNL